MSRRHIVAVILIGLTAVGGIVTGCTAEAETRVVAPVAVAPAPPAPRPMLIPPPPDPVLAFPPKAMVTPLPSPAARPEQTTQPTTSPDRGRSSEPQRRRYTEEELRERARTLTNDDLGAGRGSMPDGGLTSGETQLMYGCEQGYIPASECN